MLHSPGNLAGNCSEMTVLERQQEARMKWQLQLEQREGEKDGFGGSELGDLSFMANADYKEMGYERFLMNGGESMFGEVVNIGNPVKPESGTRNGWPDLSCFEMENLGFPGGLGSEMNNYAVSRTSSCAPLLTEEMMEAAVAAVAIDSDELSLRVKGEVNYSVERESSKKRKPEKMESTKIQEDIRKKKIRQSTEDENSKITIQSNNSSSSNSSSSKSSTSKDKNNSSRETSVCTSKGNSKASEIPKTDYIHVRAQRGQATDSHSLAERARRERISERMKYLQELVPGCTKINGKARMLDEIINYVQSLQRQVEFLSMKMASLNPRLDFSIGNLFCNEMFRPYMANLPTIETASEISEADYLQFNPVQKLPSCSGLEIGISPNANSQRTVNTPDASIPSVYFDPSFSTVIPRPKTTLLRYHDIYLLSQI